MESQNTFQSSGGIMKKLIKFHETCYGVLFSCLIKEIPFWDINKTS